jgi:protein O-GlcNAc transferase
MNRKQRRAAFKHERSALPPGDDPRLEPVLAAAVEHLRAGRLDEAAAAHRRVLAVAPGHAVSLHHLGLIEHKRGNHEQAANLVRQCLTGKVEDADAWSNLSVILRELGRFDEAITAAEKAITLRPRHAGAHTNLGNLLRQRGRVADAVRAHAMATRLEPEFAAAHANLADALLAQNQLAEALASCERAVSLAPKLAEARAILGRIQQRQGKLGDALAAYEQAMTLNPQLATLHSEIGNILRMQGRSEEAVAAHQRTIALMPSSAEAYGHLGVTLQTLGRWNEAAAAYRQAIALAPDFMEAHSNLGVLLQAMGKPAEAIPAYRAALALNPRYANAHYNLGNALKELDRLEEAIHAYRQAIACDGELAAARFQLCNVRRHACDWRGLEQEEADCLSSLRGQGHPVSPFPVLVMSADPALHLEHARRWARRLATLPHKRSGRPAAHPAPSDGRMRIGYLSCDFHRHATGSLIAELLERHDRSRFDVIGYCFSPEDGSDMRRRLVAAFDSFVDVRALSHADAARRIHTDRIDILVDLKGYTKDARSEILAHRPAPVQVNYLGYPGTMGADFIDYIIADRFVAPMQDQAHYAERIVQLPDSYQPNDSRRRIAERAPSRAECGLPEEGFVFCSFNGAYKITQTVFGIWMRLLQAVPGSVLWQLDTDTLAKSNLRREALSYGVDPERIVFAPKLRMEEHLARQRLGDLFLDTLPVNAHTTASDALWAGLPVVTCAGDAFIGRVAGSLLHAMGLPELVTHTLADYEALALSLATNPGALADVRARLARNRLAVPLFDIARYARNIEAAYVHMARLSAAGRRPEAFAVRDLTG